MQILIGQTETWAIASFSKMALSVLPSQTELASLDTVEKVRLWVGVDSAVWTRFSSMMGTFPNVRTLASLPLSSLRAGMSAVRIATTGDPPQRELTPAEIIHVALMWRVARQAFGIQDVDPLAPPSAGDGAAATLAVLASPGRKKVKANAVIDQMDESEIDILNQSELDEAYQNHVALTGWDPPAEAEPTPEQIAALKTKVVIRGEAPYADFSVLTPYGRRMQKQMKARSWILQADGTFKALDVPGPPTFDAWKACFRVYKAALFMLRYPGKPASATSPAVSPKLVVTPAALEEYFELVSKLNDEFPETWHLLLQAEDRCRAEMFERFRRELTRAAAEGKMPMGLTFDGEAPWSGVFQYAARNERFWNEHVVESGPLQIS